MTRHVVENRQVAHLWANQSQSDARSGNGNFHFSGTKIFSYRTCIANIVQNAKGESVVLRTSETYSITTSGKHENAISGALGYRNANRDEQGRKVFYVPNVESGFNWSMETGHKANLDSYIAKARDLIAKTKTIQFASYGSRDVTAESYGESKLPLGFSDPLPSVLADAGKVFESALAYAETFGLPLKLNACRKELWAALKAWHVRKARFFDPKQVAKREREAARRAARKEAEEQAKREAQRAANLEWFANWKAGTTSRPPSYHFDQGSAEQLAIIGAEQIEELNHRRDAGEAFDSYMRGGPDLSWFQINRLDEAQRLAFDMESKARQHVKDALLREAWLSGGNVAFRGVDPDGRAYIRAVDLRRDDQGELTGGTLQTSQGATVPLVEALRVFRFLKLVRDKGEPWSANGQRIQVGGFRVNRIEANGDFQAGCHRIAFAECARLAMRLGVAGIEADESALISSQRAA